MMYLLHLVIIYSPSFCLGREVLSVMIVSTGDKECRDYGAFPTTTAKENPASIPSRINFHYASKFFQGPDKMHKHQTEAQRSSNC